MPLTKQQAQMIAELMRDSRPSGANRWDISGCMAALAKVADRSLPEVVRAATRLAESREVRTPMALPEPGPQWREAEYKPKPKPFDATTSCGVCSLEYNRCRSQWQADHEYERADAAKANKLDGEALASVMAELRDRIAGAIAERNEADEPDKPKPLTGEEHEQARQEALARGDEGQAEWHGARAAMKTNHQQAARQAARDELRGRNETPEGEMA